MIITSVISRALPALLLALIPLAAWSATASAQATVRPELELTVPTSAAVGDTVEITATLTAEGAPVPDARVTFLRDAVFLNNSDTLPIGEGRTNASGIATVEFAPRSEGETAIFAQFEGLEGLRSAFAESSIDVATGPPQYTQETGISVPGIGFGWLVLLLCGVWGSFLFVMFLVFRIARDGDTPPAAGAAAGGSQGD